LHTTDNDQTENLCLIQAKNGIAKQLDTMQEERVDFEALNAEAHKLRVHNSVLDLHTNELRKAIWLLKKYTISLEIHVDQHEMMACTLHERKAMSQEIEKAQQKQIQRLESLLGPEDQDIAFLQQKIVGLTDSISRFEEGKQSLDMELVTTKEEHNELCDELRSVSEKRNELPEKIQSTISNQRKMAFKQLAVIKDLRDELKDLHTKHAQSSAATRTLQDEGDRLTKQVAALQTGNEQAYTIIETLRASTND
jgi:chromosome segregation ATPase